MAKNAGIKAWAPYVPSTYVEQSELEQFDGVGEGKYTKGLGQARMAFAEPYEDIVSMMLTATHQLLETSGIRPDQIGRVEVGTETLVDKSKSTKTSLMRLFGDNTDIEGVDTINACYGGTNALFNCLNWMSSPAWDGRYAIVVTGDIAVYEPGPARCSGGAGVVALLLGPDAPVVIDICAPRATHMEDVYDFYKPDLKSEYPIVDGHLSNACYFRALDRCFARLATKSSGTFDFRNFEHSLFHQPYQKLVQKSFGRMLFNQHKLTGDVDPALDPFAALPEEETYANRDLDKLLAKISSADYQTKTFPSTLIGRESGNWYTGSLYAALVSLVSQHGAKLDGEKSLMFSYGSGLAATMFQTKFQNNDGELAKLAETTDLEQLLASRSAVSPTEYTASLERREAAYGQFPMDLPQPSPELLRPGAYHLTSVDTLGRRSYARSMSTSTVGSGLPRRSFHTRTTPMMRAQRAVASMGIKGLRRLR
jgi:hydroxymethylglutaryl-CoA synthase